MDTFALVPMTGTGLVVDGPAHFYGLLFDTGTDGEGVTIYDGKDPNSGRNLGNISGWQHDPNVVMFPHAARIEVGLYVVFESGVVSALFLVDPIHSDHTVRSRSHHEPE